MGAVSMSNGSAPSDYSGITLTHLEWNVDDVRGSSDHTTETVYDNLTIYTL